MYHTEGGAVGNHVDTYDQAAKDLIEQGHLVLNWTDGRGTLLNVLLSAAPKRVGEPGGIVDSGLHKLWVGVAGRGCFGFPLGNGYLAPGYVSEKLGVSGGTAAPLSELLSHVRQRICTELARHRVEAAIREGR